MNDDHDQPRPLEDHLTPASDVQPEPLESVKKRAAQRLKESIEAYAKAHSTSSDGALLALALANGLYDPDKLTRLGAPRALVKGLRSAQRRIHRP